MVLENMVEDLRKSLPPVEPRFEKPQREAMNNRSVHMIPQPMDESGRDVLCLYLAQSHARIRQAQSSVGIDLLGKWAADLIELNDRLLPDAHVEKILNFLFPTKAFYQCMERQFPPESDYGYVAHEAHNHFKVLTYRVYSIFM